VGLIGPRQVGKTTLAKETQKQFEKSIYLDLELTSDMNKLLEPELYLSQHLDKLVIIDEIQRMPGLFPLIRALVDQNRVPGRFLILGSSSPALIKKSSESLAGRIIYHELSPLNLNETGYSETNLHSLWVKGGFPESYLKEKDDISFSWREAFIRTFLERDIPLLGIRIPAIQLRKFWTMIAHTHGQLLNSSMLSKNLGISAPTVRNYLDLLEETFVIRQILPYYTNIKKRLIKSPKVYLRDSGLLHTLLNLGTYDELVGHPVVGHSWEGFVIEQIYSILPGSIQKYFYRTTAGAEIDLLVFHSPQKTAAIEIKYSAAPQVSRGFHSAFEDTGCSRGFVIYPGKERYPIGKKIEALPISELERIREAV